MKKILLGTTAAVAGVAMAGPAMAEFDASSGRVHIDVGASEGGGFGSGFVPGQQVGELAFGTGYHLDWEPTFSAEAAGLTWKWNSRLRAQDLTGSGAQTSMGMRRNWVTVGNGDVGHVRFGRGEIAAGQYQTAGGPQTVFGHYWSGGFGRFFTGEGAVQAGQGAYAWNFDTNAISYTTPAIQGFMASVSAQNFGQDGNGDAFNDFAVSGQYGLDAGGGSITVAGALNIIDENNTASGDSETGLQFGASGWWDQFAVGGDVSSTQDMDEWLYSLGGKFSLTDTFEIAGNFHANTTSASDPQTQLYGVWRPAGSVALVPALNIEEDNNGAQVRTTYYF